MKIWEMQAVLLHEQTGIEQPRETVTEALEAALAALEEIHEILNGPDDEPGKEWSSDEIEWVANVIIGIGFNIREPGEGGDDEDEAGDEEDEAGDEEDEDEEAAA